MQNLGMRTHVPIASEAPHTPLLNSHNSPASQAIVIRPPQGWPSPAADVVADTNRAPKTLSAEAVIHR